MTKLAFIKHRIAAGVRDEGGVLPALKKAGRLLWDGGFNKLLLIPIISLRWNIVVGSR